jgi:hypothetical protein
LKNKWALEDVTLKFDCLEKTNIQLEERLKYLMNGGQEKTQQEEQKGEE